MIHLCRNEVYLGAFELEVIHAGLENGRFHVDDFARQELADHWEPLCLVLIRASVPKGVLLVEAWKVWSAQAGFEIVS